MHGLGTIINTAAIVAGGLGGALFGRFLKENVQDTLTKCCGVSTLFIAITGALERMLTVEEGQIVSSGAMLVILCLTIGAVIGELADLEGGLRALWRVAEAENRERQGPALCGSFRYRVPDGVHWRDGHCRLHSGRYQR